MSFNNLGLSPSLLTALSKGNYEQATPIQEKVIPVILQGKDVLGISPTGSGKTASFVLPILMKVAKDTSLKNRKVKVLVVVPTRELAHQVNEVFQKFNKGMKKRIKSLAVFGGVSINPQMIALQNVHILVATPGRLLDLIRAKAVRLSDVHTLILDEADKMLTKSFQEELHTILALMPAKRQNLLFSATLNKKVKQVKQLLLTDPAVIKIATKETDIELITQSAYLVDAAKKGPFLRYLIKNKQLNQVLIFASAVRTVKNLTVKLTKNGIDALGIHSQKSQGARTAALKKFKEGEIQVLVTTDLLARGIDIESLPYVINYELPRSPKDYIHRIGRTGRAAASGEAITLLTSTALPHFKIIQKKMGKQVTITTTEEIDLHGF